MEGVEEAGGSKVDDGEAGGSEENQVKAHWSEKEASGATFDASISGILSYYVVATNQ